MQIKNSRQVHATTPASNHPIKARSTTNENVSSVQVIGYLDQHEQKWLRVGFKGAWAFGRITNLVKEPSSFYAQLAEKGVTILEPGLRKELASKAQAAEFKKRGHVVDRLGWHGSSYVQAGTELPKTVDGARPIDARVSAQVSLGTAGSLAAWKAGVRRLANRQALPTFVLGCAFAALIQHLVSEVEDNIGFELFGESSIGKSTLLRLAGSVFGPKEAVVRSWDTTVNALEPTMAACGDGLLLIDEENLFLDSVPDANRKLNNAIHKLAKGSEKGRLTNEKQRDHRFLFLSTSNMPIAEVVRGIGRNRVAAVEVRMPTIPADAGNGLGIFDSLPEGCATSAEAVAQVTALTEAHYGWAARAFIERLETRLATLKSRGCLVDSIHRQMAEFRGRANALGGAGVENRVLDKFAVVYAGAHLARRWRILPLDHVGVRVMSIYSRYHAAQVTRANHQWKHEKPASALERVQDYVRRHTSELYDITTRDYPDLTDEELEKYAGFLRTKGGVTRLLIPAARFSAEFGNQAKSILQELSSEQRLHATDGYGCQLKVRRSKRKDRVYSITTE